VIVPSGHSPATKPTKNHTVTLILRFDEMNGNARRGTRNYRKSR
jgi:hypothetical protein